VRGLRSTIVYERGDKLYLVAPVTPLKPSDEEVAGFAFGADMTKRAPNPHIAWFRGHYVEADVPNGNGMMWTAKDLQIASMTPMLMPVTIMHDPRTAVGAIADLSLRTPDNDQVPRAKIDTALALWAHRFPDVVDEANHNHERGTLMQSMECLAPAYDCSVCGMGFIKLPRGAERANWCSHLKGEGDVTAARILRAVVFTGTGLIFGSRGATGADPSAHLETFQEEVAEFHQRVHRDTAQPRRARRMETVEIAKSEYDELRSRPERRELDEVVARAEKAEKDVETAEAGQKKAEGERDDLRKKVDQHEEQARQVRLRDERLDALGGGFLDALGDKTKERLRTQAGALDDADWTARLEELEELTGKKRDLGGKEGEGGEGNGGGTFTAEEIARHQGGSGPSPNNAQTPGQRRSVVAGLSKSR
jgi:hypothetical protein